MSSHAHFEIRRTSAGGYFWLLQIGSARLVADSGETYSSISECRAMIEWIQQHGAVMPIEDLSATPTSRVDHAIVS